MQFLRWQDLPGNKSIGKLHPLMLTPEGYTVRRNVSTGRGGIYSNIVSVTFDRDYVVWRFKELLGSLKLQTPEEVEQLLKEVQE